MTNAIANTYHNLKAVICTLTLDKGKETFEIGKEMIILGWEVHEAKTDPLTLPNVGGSYTKFEPYDDTGLYILRLIFTHNAETGEYIYRTGMVFKNLDEVESYMRERMEEEMEYQEHPW